MEISIIEDDPDDNRILECATASDSKFIITNDNHLLRLKKFRDIIIISPKQFLTR